MKMTSGNSRTASLKTYSRRDNTTTERPSGKRKLSEGSQSVVELPPAKKIARSSIQSYFEPLSSSSSPALSRSSTLQSSDSVESPSSPPSSPPPELVKPPIALRRFQKRPKRRLSTKPKHLPTATMSSTSHFSPQICFQCVGGQPNGYICKEHITMAVVNVYSDSSFTRGIQSLAKPENAREPPRPDQLQQLQLQFGAKPKKEPCKICGMPYIASVPEDVKLHKSVHDTFVTCDANKVDLDSITLPASFWSLDPINNDNRQVRPVKVHLNSPVRALYFASLLLERVNEELGYEKNHVIGKYDVFAALVGNQPIAAIVTERGICATPYIRATLKNPDDPPEVRGIRLLIDRLWVHKDFRGLRVATKLLDAVLEHHGLEKHKVAFSAPTESGRKFACKYFAGVFDQAYPNRNVKFMVNYDEFPLPEKFTSTFC
ncbi:hypothetical protein VTL71DRAFT_4411 [Oculimacula yallundae]|uniref:N-acetyltransferase domain-containing protein n=1 Tax=Oculimacula yallundae TaxID=86028 RepID=A0ABR4C319_9HELO